MSNDINLYFIPSLISSLLLLTLGLFVLRNSSKYRANYIFSLECFTSSLWQFGYSMMYFFSDSEKAAFFWMKVGYVGVIFISVFYYHFIVEFLKIKRSRIIVAFSYVIACFFLGAHLFTDKFTSGVIKYSWGYYPKAGPLHPAFLLFFITLICLIIYHTLMGFLRRNKLFSDRRKDQVKYLFWAYFLYSPACIDFLANYNIPVYPFGYIFATSFLGIIAYAIVRHQLMEIEVLIKKTIVYAGLFAGVYGVITIFTFLGQSVFEVLSGGNRWIALVPSIAVIVIILRPLENFLVKITDRFLFQKKYDYKQLLKTFSTEVLTLLNISELTKTTVEKLSEIMKIESCGVLLKNKIRNSYDLRSSVGVDRKWRSMSLSMDNTLTTFLERTKSYLSTKQQGEDSPIPKRIMDDMNKLKLELAIPLFIYDDMIGILTLGKKKSDEDYTQDDMDILLPLARTLSIAISNAQVLDELSKTQAEAAQREKMAVIGTLSAGINHEICNPLGIARGHCEAFILNLRDGLYRKKTKEELLDKSVWIMKKVISETDRATAITKRLSSFAKPSKGIFTQDVDIHESINEVLALLGYEMKMDKIAVTNGVPKDFPHIIADKKQIEEVFFNLVRNAAQAIEEKGSITVSALEENGKLVVEIQDTGYGMPQEKLNQIFNPFYTTKAPGKGTGLGLFIVRQVVERNKGVISVTSKEGIGTKFRIEFPVTGKEAKLNEWSKI